MLLTAEHILRTEGWSGLYDGVASDTTANFLSRYVILCIIELSFALPVIFSPNISFLYFLFYTFIRTLVAKRRSRLALLDGKKKNPAIILLSAPEEIGIGFLSGVASRSIILPLNVITVRLQTANKDDEEQVNLATNERKESTFSSTVKDIHREDGLSGFWRGRRNPICLLSSRIPGLHVW